MPPSDWMGSRNSAATSPGGHVVANSSSRRASTAPPTSPGSGGRYGSGYGSSSSPASFSTPSCAVCPEIAIEPAVPPWYAPAKDRMRGRPVAFRIARTAVSFASDPEWPSQTRRSPSPGTAASRSSASATAGSLIEDRTLADAMERTAPDTASTTAGCP